MATKPAQTHTSTMNVKNSEKLVSLKAIQK